MSIMMSATVTSAWQSPSSGGVGEVEGAMMTGYAEAVLALLGDSSITRTPEPMPYLPSNRRGQDDDVSQQGAGKKAMFNNSISVYPNPFQNSFTVEFSLTEVSIELRFEIFDLTGRRIKDSLIMNALQGRVEINLNPCAGLYFLRVSDSGKVIENRKLICFDR